MRTELKVEGRKIRHLRVRTKGKGTAERPRLAIFRSLNHLYAQVVDDTAGRTLVSVDSRSMDFRGRAKSGGNVAAAKIIGELVAKKAKAGGIDQVVFDRGGYPYHGGGQAPAPGGRPGRRRPGRLPVPRAGQGPRRGGPRRRPIFLMRADC